MTEKNKNKKGYPLDNTEAGELKLNMYFQRIHELFDNDCFVLLELKDNLIIPVAASRCMEELYAILDHNEKSIKIRDYTG